ncbi:MAG: hypothetical protein JOZ96_05565 [Acidobacteria bacterium]|nr:hypothetical protein [Acidobacteriota bacterium]
MSKKQAPEDVVVDVSMKPEALQKLLEQGERPATLHSLMEVYQVDPEVYLQLAVGGAGPDSPRWAQELGELAARVRVIVRRGYEVQSNGNGKVKVVSGEIVEQVAKKEAEEVLAFLRDLNGVTVGREPVRDFAGRQASEAEVVFALGTASDREAARRRVETRMAADPVLLRLSSEDKAAVAAGMPGYVVYGLLYCAPEVIRAPTVVFEGLRGEGRLKRGRAYCGVPKNAYDNDGNPVPRPDKMVYVIYTDAEGYVFDWDWVREGEKPGFPCGYEERFAREVEAWRQQDFRLAGLDGLRPGEFRKGQAWFSQRGDCVFWYSSDSPTFAERLNEDLTVFRTFDTQEVVGSKCKNITRIVSDLQNAVAALLSPREGTDVGALLARSLIRQAEKGALEEEDLQVYHGLYGRLRQSGASADRNLYLYLHGGQVEPDRELVN